MGQVVGSHTGTDRGQANNKQYQNQGRKSESHWERNKTTGESVSKIRTKWHITILRTFYVVLRFQTTRDFAFLKTFIWFFSSRKKGNLTWALFFMLSFRAALLGQIFRVALLGQMQFAKEYPLHFNNFTNTSYNGKCHLEILLMSSQCTKCTIQLRLIVQLHGSLGASKWRTISPTFCWHF